MTIFQSLQRRLTDRLRAAFHTACDDEDELVAKGMLDLLRQQVEAPANLPGGHDRRAPEDLTGPGERLASIIVQNFR
ncbi:MAG TPA: hypothetical protein VE690_22900 [Rhodopila sp.]|nr:hypothetical protein [Rhodopila sp.]